MSDPEFREVLERLAALLDAHAEAADAASADEGADNFECQACTDCVSCRFCVDCEECVRCSYCERCSGCEDCTHCRASVDLVSCSHAAHARACTECRYVTLCFDCEGCTHCFACVGLSGAEFCFLNEPLPRKRYFERVRAFEGALARLEARGVLLAFEDDLDDWTARIAEALGASAGGGTKERGNAAGTAPPEPSRPSPVPPRPRGSVRAVRRPRRLDDGGAGAQKPDP